MSHASVHIANAGSELDPGSCREVDHLRRLSRMQRSNSASAPRSAPISTRPGGPDESHRLRCWLWRTRSLRLLRPLRRSGHHHGQQSPGITTGLNQLAPLESLKARRKLNTWFAFTPFARARLRHARTWFEGQLDNPPLLRYRTSIPAPMPANHSLGMNHVPMLT